MTEREESMKRADLTSDDHVKDTRGETGKGFRKLVRMSQQELDLSSDFSMESQITACVWPRNSSQDKIYSYVYSRTIDL